MLMWNAVRRRFRRRHNHADVPSSFGPGASVTPTAPAAPAPSSEPPAVTPSATAVALAQPVIERLSEDEALRGDLTDAGFAPLLDWLTRLAAAAAQRAITDPQPEATMEQVGDAARKLGRAVVRAAERGDTRGVATALVPPLTPSDMTERATAAILALPPSATPDERAQALARALSAIAPGASERA